MGRADRRALERKLRKQVGKVQTPESITLRGGPMDGWTVRPNAPALEPDWRDKYLEEAARELWEQTRRSMATSSDVPIEAVEKWDDVAVELKRHFIGLARERHGAGRYVLVEGTRLPEARWEAS